MTDFTEIVAYDVEPPAPMAIFDERVIHPDNQARIDAIQERLNRFKPLPRFQRMRMQSRMKHLHGKLKRRGVFKVVALLNQLYTALSDTHTAFVALRLEVEEVRKRGEPIPAPLKGRAAALKKYGEKLQARMMELEAKIDPFAEDYAEYVRVRDRLVENMELVTRRKAEKENHKQFLKEGKIVRKALIATFLMTEGCYINKYKRGGKVKRIAPNFQEIYLNSTVHSFVLLTSKKGLFGGWTNKLQVDIERLVDPKTTLKNASAILHRQVWVDYDQTGSLPIYKVNRLDIRDGLPERVIFGGLLEIYPVTQHQFVPIPVGLGENFRARWMTFETTPHLLIAGATRSGKSNFVNAIICCLLYMQSPEEVRFIAIDNKEGVEFNRYARVPHLVGTITDTGDQVLPVLKSAWTIMKRRLRLLKETNAKNMLAFNKAVPTEQRIPRLIIFIDEMATLLHREDTSEIHYALMILTAQGAAAGVHIIAATQYPNSETVPMPIKGNMDGIIGFRMPNFHASNMLFNSDDAFRMEKNKGRAYISDAGDRYKSQTPFISDTEVDRAIRFACDQYAPMPFSELPSEEDTSPFELPAAQPPAPVFGEGEVLRIALEQFEGALKADKIYGVVKNNNVTTVRQVRALVESIKARALIEVDGVKYEAEKQAGNFWKLVEKTAETAEVTDRQPDSVPV